jgi:hypothetical protein
MIPGLLIIAAVALLVVFAWIFRSRSVIKNPRFGILDLSAGSCLPLVAEDKEAISGLFASLQESKSDVPRCDVLFIYAILTEEGRILGCKHGLREIIRDAGAKVVVVASENTRDSCSNAAVRKPYGEANLVITFSRRGEAFARFFRELFSKMKQGSAMPAAWVKLAPQNPSSAHVDCPITIFLCEAGPVRFKA